MPPVVPIVLVAPWWRRRARGATRYTPFAGLPAAEQAWRGARAMIWRTHPSGELWPRSAEVVILIIYDVRMILSLASRLIARDKCIGRHDSGLEHVLGWPALYRIDRRTIDLARLRFRHRKCRLQVSGYSVYAAVDAG